MKARRFMTIAIATTLVLGGLSIPARAAIAEQDALRAQAQTELPAVTLDVDKANILYSPADNTSGPRLEKVQRYHKEYLKGLQRFQEGNYSSAIKHLRETDEIIRAQPEWNEVE
jgi:hypothetical protein